MTQLTVLVTGATAGFGQAIAKRYLAEGHQVIAAGRRQDRRVFAADRPDALWQVRAPHALHQLANEKGDPLVANRLLEFRNVLESVRPLRAAS